MSSFFPGISSASYELSDITDELTRARRDGAVLNNELVVWSGRLHHILSENEDRLSLQEKAEGWCCLAAQNPDNESYAENADMALRDYMGDSAHKTVVIRGRQLMAEMLGAGRKYREKQKILSPLENTATRMLMSHIYRADEHEVGKILGIVSNACDTYEVPLDQDEIKNLATHRVVFETGRTGMTGYLDNAISYLGFNKRAAEKEAMPYQIN